MRRIKRFLKKHLVPHRHNDHKPHLLRDEAFSLLFGALLLLEGMFLLYVTVVVPNSGFLAEIAAPALVELANADRARDGVSELVRDSLLEQAAQMKAEDMAARGYFSHDAPEGTKPWHWLDIVGYNYSYAGENLAVNYSDSIDVQRAWMDSSGHRANILSSQFSEVGIGVAEGVYEGRSAVFIVEFFGTKASEKIAVAAPQESTPPAKAARDNAPAPLEETVIVSAPDISQTQARGGFFDTPLAFASAQTIASSPRNLFSYLTFPLLALVLFVLAFMFAKGKRAWHKPLLANGFAVVAMIVLFAGINSTIAQAGMTAGTEELVAEALL